MSHEDPEHNSFLRLWEKEQNIPKAFSDCSVQVRDDVGRYYPGNDVMGKKKKKKKDHPKVAEVIGYNQAQKQVETDTEMSCKIGVVIRIVWLATVFWQWLTDYVDCKAYKK